MKPIVRALTACALLAALAACVSKVEEDTVALEPAGFHDLPGWRADDPAPALDALARSCRRHLARPASAPVGPLGIGGIAGDWHGPCGALALIDRGTLEGAKARAFVESHFVPFAVSGSDGEEGLFTGYYEPTVRGSRTRSARFDVPIYARPEDLVQVDLGDFSEDFRGRTIAGRVNSGRLVPYPDRRSINRGRLAGRGLELLWLDDPVDAFFLEIQGSGRIVLEDGSILRVGYAAKNGRAYTSIGKVLAEMGAIPLEQVSMQSIRDWLAANPQKARAVMEENRSFVFFRVLDGDGPIGAEGVALTPGRSLAVDRRFLPLGTPVYVAAEARADTAARGLAPHRRLMVAQDTGGAIRGPVRGDVFLGAGAAAAETAGRFNMRGRYWLLLPKATAERRARQS